MQQAMRQAGRQAGGLTGGQISSRRYEGRLACAVYTRYLYKNDPPTG